MPQEWQLRASQLYAQIGVCLHEGATVMCTINLCGVSCGCLLGRVADCHLGKGIASLCFAVSPQDDTLAAAAAAAPAQPMDIELASRPDIPEMPAGWKPGDPLPHLPPMPPGVHACYAMHVSTVHLHALALTHPSHSH